MSQFKRVFFYTSPDATQQELVKALTAFRDDLAGYDEVEFEFSMEVGDLEVTFFKAWTGLDDPIDLVPTKRRVGPVVPLTDFWNPLKVSDKAAPVAYNDSWGRGRAGADDAPTEF